MTVDLICLSRSGIIDGGCKEIGERSETGEGGGTGDDGSSLRKGAHEAREDDKISDAHMLRICRGREQIWIEGGGGV